MYKNKEPLKTFAQYCKISILIWLEFRRLLRGHWKGELQSCNSCNNIMLLCILKWGHVLSFGMQLNITSVGETVCQGPHPIPASWSPRGIGGYGRKRRAAGNWGKAPPPEAKKSLPLHSSDRRPLRLYRQTEQTEQQEGERTESKV